MLLAAHALSTQFSAFSVTNAFVKKNFFHVACQCSQQKIKLSALFGRCFEESLTSSETFCTLQRSCCATGKQMPKPYGTKCDLTQENFDYNI